MKQQKPYLLAGDGTKARRHSLVGAAPAANQRIPIYTDDAIVARYKSLAFIELGFKVLKFELEIGPVYHRLSERIRAHAAICLILRSMEAVLPCAHD